MIEALVAVAFAVVIVVGMVTGQVWSRVVSEGMPIVRRWVTIKLDENAGLPALDHDEREALMRRIHHLEEQVEFLEALVERGGDDTNRSPSKLGHERP